MNDIQIRNTVFGNEDGMWTVNYNATFSDGTHIEGSVQISDGDYQDMTLKLIKQRIIDDVVKNLQGNK